MKHKKMFYNQNYDYFYRSDQGQMF